VVRAIGGTSLGGAAITNPVVWSDLYLQYVFNPALSRPSYTPTYILADPPEVKNSTTPVPTPLASNGDTKTAVIGGVVGGILGALVLGVVAFYFAYWRKRSKPTGFEQAGELPATAVYDGKPNYSGHMASPMYKTIVPVELTAGTRSELGTYHVSELEVPDQGVYSPATTYSSTEKGTPLSSYASPVSPEDAQSAKDSPTIRLAGLSEDRRA
jgi:hypothetical protein